MQSVYRFRSLRLLGWFCLVGSGMHRAQLYHQASGRIHFYNFEIGRPRQIENNARRAWRSLRHAHLAEKSIANLMRGQPALLDPRPGMQNIEEQTIGIMCAIRSVFKRTGGFDNDPGRIRV